MASSPQKLQNETATQLDMVQYNLIFPTIAYSQVILLILHHFFAIFIKNFKKWLYFIYGFCKFKFRHFLFLSFFYYYSNIKRHFLWH